MTGYSPFACRLTAFLGAVQIGLIFGLVALGVFLSFRVLNFPDLTVDGSFPLGAAVAASLIVHGVDPFLATAIAILAGAAAGLVTAFLNLRFGILHLLASILTMIALYSINLRIMGRPNIGVLNEWTILSPFAGHGLEQEVSGDPGRRRRAGRRADVFLVRFLLSDYGLACAPPAPIRAWRARKASIPRGRPMSAWPSAMGWWRWPGRCSRRSTASPT